MSIAAEIIAARWGGQGSRLADVEGPIHHPTSRHPAPDVTGSATDGSEPLQHAQPARRL